MKKRTLTVDIDEAAVHKSWASSVLTIRQYGESGVGKEVNIRIRTPTDISYLREKLGAIEAYWRSCLGERTP